MKHWVIRCCSAAAVFLMCAVPAHAADITWPATDIAAHARAWFEMLRGDDAAARQFLTDHMAPSALAEASMEERLARRRGVMERTGGLTPLQAIANGEGSLDVRCKAGNGDRVVATFTAEPGAPHRIVSVRLMAEPPGGGDAPMAPAGPALSDEEAAAAMRATLDQRAAAGTWSGAALLARRGQVVVSGAWGEADRAQHVRNTEATRFNVGSIGKLLGVTLDDCL